MKIERCPDGKGSGVGGNRPWAAWIVVSARRSDSAERFVAKPRRVRQHTPRKLALRADLRYESGDGEGFKTEIPVYDSKGTDRTVWGTFEASRALRMAQAVSGVFRPKLVQKRFDAEDNPHEDFCARPTQTNPPLGLKHRVTEDSR